MTTERGIIFAGPMERAIQEGRKTETRRVVKPEPHPDTEDFRRNGPGVWAPVIGGYLCGEYPVERLRRCPYGVPGDLLYVRENLVRSGGLVQYIANHSTTPRHLWPAEWKRDGVPSIHCPKRFARLWLRVEDVRVERLRKIDEAGAIAEGISWETGEQDRNVRKWGETQTARMKFADLWDKINGKRAPWNSNPWVWVVRFSKTDSP